MSESLQPSRPVTVVQITDDREEIERVEEQLLADIEGHGYPKSSRFAIKLAFEEGVTNAFQHGHKNLPPDTPVTVSFAVDHDSVFISVEDQGPGFTPDAVPDPTLDENLSLPSGRGIMLMRAYMTEIRHSDRGNRVEMLYRRPAVD